MKIKPIFFLVILFFLAFPIFSNPTKIYLMILNSSELDKEKATGFRKSLQDAISMDGKYSLIDEDTIKNSTEKLKKQQLLGCDETICLREIANAYDTEELMTGDFKITANKTNLTLKLTSRSAETFEVGIKSTFSLSFFESQKSYYIKEIIKKIKNPLYTINDSSAPPVGGTGTSTTKLPFQKLPPKIVVNEIERKNVEENPSEVNFFNNFMYDGLQFLKQKNYKSAEEKFKSAEKYAVDKKINPESLSLSFYKDLVYLLPLEAGIIENYNSLQRISIWSISSLKEGAIPFWESSVNQPAPILSSTEGKRIYTEFKDNLYTTYLLLSGEKNQLLYSSNKLEEFASSFKTHEKVFTRYKQEKTNVTPYISKEYTNLSDKSIMIEKEYLPSWNKELQINCIKLYYASKVFPKIQSTTKEDYSSTYNALEFLYNSTKNQLLSGKNVLTDLTIKSCQGIK